MNQLYPLKFKPIYKEKIWGGNRIKSTFNPKFEPMPNCGEAWLISGVEDSQSVVINGFLADNELNELIEVYMTELVGEKVYYKYKNTFPILIKLIDATDWLSVQVHPDDVLAQKRHNTFGKTEMWFINHAEPNAELISGFNRELNPDSYLKYIAKGRLKDILNFVHVHEEDSLLIPAGKVHALGPGILLTEIQQTSDITYRIYDWDRLDAEGKSRELHNAQALDAINFKLETEHKILYNKKLNNRTNLVTCPYFTTNILKFNTRLDIDFNTYDSFLIYIGQKGNVTISYENGTETIAPGEAILVPAVLTNISLIPDSEAQLLEVYLDIPKP